MANTHEFVRAAFKPGGREYTYMATPDQLAVGDQAVTPGGKSVTVTAVKTSDALVNGKPLPPEAYGWLAKKVAEAEAEATVLTQENNDGT